MVICSKNKMQMTTKYKSKKIDDTPDSRLDATLNTAENESQKNKLIFLIVVHHSTIQYLVE